MQRPLRKARFVVIWLSAFLTLLLGLLFFGILLIRREAVEYYLDYQFAVKDPEFFPAAHALSDPLPVIFSVLGSSNFDARSAQINEELDITVYDEAFGREMQAVFDGDLQRSRPYSLEDF